MAATLVFELVSPEKLLVSRPVEMVTMPGSEGYFGVLPGHAPLIATLKPGVINIQEGGQTTDRLFVAGGFAEVTQDRCTVLAEQATSVSSLDRAAIEQELQDIEREPATAATETRLAVVRAKLEAVRTAA